MGTESIAIGHLRTSQRVVPKVLTCSKRGNLSTRVIGFYVPILTKRGCILVHPAHSDKPLSMTTTSLPVGRRHVLTIFIFSSRFGGQSSFPRGTNYIWI